MILLIYYLIIKIRSFRRDLSGISIKIATLHPRVLTALKSEKPLQNYSCPNFAGRGNRTVLTYRLGTWAVLLFSKLNQIFIGYFDPEMLFSIMKITTFRGDLTDISALKEALSHVTWAYAMWVLLSPEDETAGCGLWVEALAETCPRQWSYFQNKILNFWTL